jgi:hypothetical protein
METHSGEDLTRQNESDAAKDHLGKPLNDPDHIIEMNFQADLSRREQVVSSLNRMKLLKKIIINCIIGHRCRIKLDGHQRL